MYSLVFGFFVGVVLFLKMLVEQQLQEKHEDSWWGWS